MDGGKLEQSVRCDDDSWEERQTEAEGPVFGVAEPVGRAAHKIHHVHNGDAAHDFVSTEVCDNRNLDDNGSEELLQRICENVVCPYNDTLCSSQWIHSTVDSTHHYVSHAEQDPQDSENPVTSSELEL